MRKVKDANRLMLYSTLLNLSVGYAYFSTCHSSPLKSHLEVFTSSRNKTLSTILYYTLSPPTSSKKDHYKSISYMYFLSLLVGQENPHSTPCSDRKQTSERLVTFHSIVQDKYQYQYQYSFQNNKNCQYRSF